MEPNEKDIMRGLFAGMPDEQLPPEFNAKVMHRIRREALRRRKRNRCWEIFGYASAAVFMTAVCIFIFYRMGITFKMPEMDLRVWSFPRPDFGIFKSRSFFFSLYIGILALFLLIVDSVIRRHAGKKHK